jgi:hypothetical protein
MIYGSLYLPDESIIKISEEIKINIDKTSKRLSLDSLNADTLNLEFKEIDDIVFMEYCYFQQSTSLIFSDLYGLTVYYVSFKHRIAKKIEQLNRKENDDRGFCQIRFVEIPNGCIFVYEAGIICFDNLGNVKWHNKHQRYDWIFIGIENGFAMYESEMDGKWGYSLDDGSELCL